MRSSHSSPKLLSKNLIVSRDPVVTRTNDLAEIEQALSDENGTNPTTADIEIENTTDLGGDGAQVMDAFELNGDPSPAMAMSALGLLTLSPIATGLTIFNVRDGSVLPMSKQVVTKWVLEKTNALEIPGPEVKKVTSVYSGNLRQQEQARAIAAANIPVSSSVLHEFRSCAARGKLDWTSNEGQCILLPIIDDANGCLILEQTINGPITTSVAQGLIQIGSAAQRAGVWVLLLLSCVGDYDSSQLMHVCDELIEVAQCEPDIGDVAAFSFDCVGIRDLNSFGIGKTMCSVKLSDGVFQYRYDPFISSNLETRVMWTMRGQEMTFDEIGVLLKKNKSSILRRLQGLPKPRQLDLPKDWLSNNLEMFPVSSRSAKSNADGENNGDAPESKTFAEQPLVKSLRR